MRNKFGILIVRLKISRLKELSVTVIIIIIFFLNVFYYII